MIVDSRLSGLLLEQQIDHWIIDRIALGVKQFDRLLISLPGVYPAAVLSSMHRLAHKGLVPRSILDDANQYVSGKSSVSMTSAQQTVPPSYYSHIPHPLDYDWRFSYGTALKLLDYASALTKPGETIALLGAPSLFNITSGDFSNRKVVLLDRNAARYVAQAKDPSTLYQCNLLRDELPAIRAQVVIVDPPWYLHQMRSFVWAAARIVNVGGQILMCLPAAGSKSGVSDEVNEALNWAERIGFQMHWIEKGALTYDSPLFERNSLKAEGIHTIPNDWRRGDLALLSYKDKISILRPLVLPEEEWVQVQIQGVEIRIRPQTQDGQFHDPVLIPIIGGRNVLPSISRGDPRRKMSDVWTQGNRIFACLGRNVLVGILKSISSEESRFTGASRMLGRNVLPHEYERILIAEKQILELINVEKSEMENFKRDQY